MNHSQLRAFHAVAVHGSFTAAAEKLYVSQPTVSDHVRALENHYQIKLFERNGRQIALTGLGRALLDISRELFTLENRAEDLLTAARGLLSGKLRVAADSPYLIMPLLGEFHRRHPGIELSLSIGNATEVSRKLLARRCDIAVLPNAPFDAYLDPAQDAPDGDPLFRKVLREDRILCVVHRTHSWAKRRSLKFEELNSQALVVRESGSNTRARFEYAMAEANVQPASMLEVGSREAVREAVAAGLGIGVISESELGHDNRLHPLKIQNRALLVVETLVCLAASRQLPIIEAFYDIARISPG